MTALFQIRYVRFNGQVGHCNGALSLEQAEEAARARRNCQRSHVASRRDQSITVVPWSK